MALINPITGQPLTQYANPFGGTVETQKEQTILNEDYNYKRPVETPQQNTVQPQTTTVPTTPETRPVLTPNSQSNILNNFSSYQLPQEEQIRQQEEKRLMLQNQVDSLNTIYNKQLEDQRQVYAGLTGQARALASRGGRLESPIYQSQQVGLSDKQQQLEGVINAERAQKIADLYDKVEQRTQEKLAAERTFATTQRDKYIELLKDQQSKAKSDAVTFAQGGGSLTDLTTEQYQKLLNDTGLDDFALKATLTVNNPKSKAQFAPVGDKIVGYYINPKTGEFETFESANIPGLAGKDAFDSVKEFGGVPYVMTKDANGVITGKPLDGYTKPEEKLSGAPAEYEYYKKQEVVAGRTPVSFNEYQTMDANRKAAANLANSGLDWKTQTAVEKINTSFENSPIVKQFNEIQNKKINVDSMLKMGDSGTVDVALVYDFMKSLDPTSVVRETEFDAAAKSGSIFKGIWAKFNGAFKEGQILPDSVKKQFQSLMDSRYKSISSQYQNLRNEKAKSIGRLTNDDGSQYLTDYSGGENFGGNTNVPLDEVDWANVNP